MEKVPAGSEGDLPLSDAVHQATCIVDYVNRAVGSQSNEIFGENPIPVLIVAMGAGFVTTSSLVSWLMYCMVAFPDMQECLLQVYSDRDIKEDTDLDFDTFNSIHFQADFIKETQRLHNPSYQPSRTVRCDCILPGAFKFPEDCVVISAIRHVSPVVVKGDITFTDTIRSITIRPFGITPPTSSPTDGPTPRSRLVTSAHTSPSHMGSACASASTSR